MERLFGRIMIKQSPSTLTAWQWDALHFSGEAGPGIWERRIIEHFVRRLSMTSTVLVLACGDGTAPRAISRLRPDLRWTGVEFSSAARDHAQKGFAWEDLLEMDLDVLPWDFRDKQFDAVIAGDILHYLKDPKAALEECIRIASRQVAVTFALSPETAGRPGLWLFEPQDPWKLLAGTDLRVHHLREGKLLLAFAGIKE